MSIRPNLAFRQPRGKERKKQSPTFSCAPADGPWMGDCKLQRPGGLQARKEPRAELANCLLSTAKGTQRRLSPKEEEFQNARVALKTFTLPLNVSSLTNSYPLS